jgi:transcriptional regulator with XRE-family HTH domain
MDSRGAEMIMIGERIKYLRLASGMSQEDLSLKLGVKRTTLSQMENGDRKICSDELRLLAEIFQMSIDEFVDPAKSPEVHIERESRPPAPNQDMRVDVPQRNLKKFREVLLYILNKVGAKRNIGETVLYKLMYFIDFNYFEKYEVQLVGATYKRNKQGPTPIEFKKIVDLMKKSKDLIVVADKYFEYPQTKYLPLRPADLSSLNGQEIRSIDQVLDRLSDMNAAQISEYSHQDVPWLSTPEGSIIPYESVFYRTPAYSARVYEDED